ncbi:LOB domain-containing protein 22 [Cornus florida]|uniref:LOB domain-containing protein 22 n=1 Tax=Cornus florida TaxID=4283 RepID=UPI00289C68EB|nr:LOB domain-containing protein 22 [Cornus florida]
MSIPRGNGTQACAACKYQRRKCAPDCILAPYFPHDRQKQFLNAHKLFGVSNITKIIRKLDKHKKDLAMRTIIFQSDVRASDPVGGCYRIICELQRQIEYSKVELDVVLHQLAIHRAQAQQQNHDHIDSALNCDGVNVDLLNPYNTMSYHDQNQLNQEQYITTTQYNHVPLQDISTAWAMQDSTSTSLQDKQGFVNECDDHLKLPLDEAGERQEFKFQHEETIEGRFEPLTLSIVSS